jgi:hypothetical protein
MVVLQRFSNVSLTQYVLSYDINEVRKGKVKVVPMLNEISTTS